MGRRSASGLLGWAAALSLSALPARAEPLDCFAAGTAIAAADWLYAERMLRARISEPRCAEHDLTLRFSLAHVLEKQSAFRPLRACDAAPLYAEVASRSQDPVLRSSASSAFPRMADACSAARAPKPPVGVEASAGAPRPRSTVLPWVTTGAAAALLVGGLATNLAARSAVAEGDRVDVLDFDDVMVRNDAYDEARAYAITSYVLMGTGAVLGGLAAWMWLSLDESPGGSSAWRPTLGPTGVGLLGAF